MSLKYKLATHLLRKIHVLGATRALRCSTTPLPYGAASRGGTQFAHEPRPVPCASGACRQWCNPTCSGYSIPIEGVRTADSRGTTQGRYCASCRGVCAIGGADEWHRPRESAFRASHMRWRKLRVVASLVCCIIGAVHFLGIGAESPTGRAQHTRRTQERSGGACSVPKHPRVLPTEGCGEE